MRGEDAPVVRHVDVLGAFDQHDAVAQRHRQHRIPPDEREASPPLAVLDRLEQEPVAVADQLGEGGDRRLEVGEQLGPHRYDGVLGGELAELVPARARCRGWWSLARGGDGQRREEAAVRPGVARPATVLGRP